MRRKQAEEDVFWETFLMRKAETAGKRRRAADNILAPATKKVRIDETEHFEAETEIEGDNLADDNTIPGLLIHGLPQAEPLVLEILYL